MIFKPPLFITFSYHHPYARGDVIITGGKSYVVTQVRDKCRIACRRTFWTWARETVVSVFA